ncbi:glycosyltransferase family 2 protein [Vibrio splendidus]
MLISVIVATFNSEATIRECLNSILSQDYALVEVIIKNGASTDATLEIIQEYDGVLNVIIDSSSDSGVYDAWNQAIELSSGDWITFLGSDDYFTHSKSISSVIPYLLEAQEKNCHLIYGNNDIIDLDGKYITTTGQSWDLAKKDIHRKMTIRHPGSFVSRDIVSRIGPFDVSFKIIGDYDFVLSCISQTRVSYYPDSCVTHRVGGLSTNPSRCLNVIRETIQLRRKHDLKPYLLMDELFFKRITLYLLSKCFNERTIIKLMGRIKK